MIQSRLFPERSGFLKILAVDLGKARTGLAVCDPDETLASPLKVLESYNQDKMLDRLMAIIREQQVEEVVIGHPLNMDGTCGESARNAQAFAQRVREKSGLNVVLQDERGTTITAAGYLNNTNTRGKKRKQVIDAVAATIILQDYLDYRKNNL